MQKLNQKRRARQKHILALLLSVVMLVNIMPLTAMAQQNNDMIKNISEKQQLLTLENIEVASIHSDGSQGDVLALDFDQNTAVFNGNLANYTDLKEYNDADISIALKGLPEETTVQLKTESGEKIADFVNGTARTFGNAVSKKGEYTYVISLQNGEKSEDYTLKLEKKINAKWNKLVFAGTPEFSSSMLFYGEPEGTLFQLDDNGERTGKTGLSEDCFDYEVYISPTTESVKPAGTRGIDIFKDSFSYANCKTSVYIDDKILPNFENIPTCMAAAMKWASFEEGIKLLKNRTEMRVEFKTGDKELVNTTITFVAGKMEVENVVSLLETLEPDKLVYPDDKDYVIKLQKNFENLTAEEKESISNELKEKLEHAYELMREDRVPVKLEIVKSAQKITYGEGQTFMPTGIELLASYADGTTRTITEGFHIEPEGALTNETEVVLIYNTVRVSHPVKVVGLNLAGDGTEENPYKLTNTEDMQRLNDVVASGQSAEGICFEMTADITLPSDWKPIGVTIDGTDDIKRGDNLYAFSGTINGNNHTVTVPEGGLPLLGYVKGAKVCNLNIYGKKIAGYGLVNNLEGVGLSGSSVIIDNVTLKSGSSTLKSGLLGANITTNGFAGCSAGFTATVRNCTVEKDVIIGYEKDQRMIGSIAGRMQGTVENCKSFAEVYGTSYVGGIIGTRDNAMGICSVTDCEFGGVVEASDNHAGGIIGGAYSNGTAPNGGRITVMNCLSDGRITGKDKVGGIMGADSYVLQSWGQNTFKKNKFNGTVKATDGSYVGGVIGYLGSLNKYDGFSANYYSGACGAENGIGFVQYIDTSCETHETESGAIYFDTSVEMPDIKGIPKANHNRTDDPLGADAVMLTYSDDNTDLIATELTIDGEYKTSYLIGEQLDFSGMTLTVTYHTGDTKEITTDDIEIQNYDSNKRGTQTVNLVYQGISVQIEVTVLKPASENITVYISVLGDTNHGSDTKDVHTLADGNLTSWMEKKTIEADVNATVLDVIEKAIEGEGIIIENPSGNYITSLTRNGTELAEVANGANSGWMYTLNGMHSRLGVSEQYLEEGDEIILHYTDDYTRESAIGSEDDIAKLGRLNRLLAKLPCAHELKLTDAAAVTDVMDLYHSLSEESKKAVSRENKDKLEAAVLKIAELRNEAAAAFEEAYKVTGNYLKEVLNNNEVFGVEWPVIGLARADRTSDFDMDAYYESVVNTIKANNSAQISDIKSTENSRLILALTAIGKDVTNIAGYNLLEPLSDFDYLKKQGINGPIWALIALDSHGYEVPENSSTAEQTTREKLISIILDAQLSDGGWALSGDNADTDMTAMALQSLAPYYGGNEKVKESVDRALECLSDLQNQDGGYASWETTNSESCSQVLTALTALGIDPADDERFIKNGNTVIQALLGFYVDGGGFRHVADGDINGMATEQGYYALAAYDRYLNKKTSLYDMTDIIIKPNETQPEPEEKDVTLNDVNNTGITITGKSDILNDKMELEVNILTSGDKYEAAKVVFKGGKFTLYDLYLLKNNVEIQPKGMVTVSIPVPDGYDEADCKIFYIDESGNLVDIKTVFADGRLVFDTNYFSLYAVWQQESINTEVPKEDDDNMTTPSDNSDKNIPKEEVSKPGDTNSKEETGKPDNSDIQNPQTGDSFNITLYFCFMILSFAGLTMIATAKRKETQK
ncbi:MAG: bacterial Ig-like domain-containing protein [Lachnospiraceae bacterium]|nr:bacterial Ig-like domain-containing protein [Lachnospiraceae bacterium]